MERERDLIGGPELGRRGSGMVETGRDRASVGERERGRAGRRWAVWEGVVGAENGGRFLRKEKGGKFLGEMVCAHPTRDFVFLVSKFSLKKLHATWKGTEKRRIKVSCIEGLFTLINNAAFLANPSRQGKNSNSS
jgi:hypothetical protein